MLRETVGSRSVQPAIALLATATVVAAVVTTVIDAFSVPLPSTEISVAAAAGLYLGVSLALDAWWVVVAARTLVFPWLFVAGPVLGALGPGVGLPTGAVLEATIGVLFVLAPVSFVAVVVDRRLVAAKTDWTPSRLWSFGVFPIFGSLAALNYWYLREKHANEG